MAYPTMEMIKAAECRQILTRCPVLPKHVRDYISLRLQWHEAVLREHRNALAKKLAEIETGKVAIDGA